MTEQNQNQLPPPPEQNPGVLMRISEGYNQWAQGMIERNPDMERGRLDVTTGVLGGIAIVTAYKLGPEFAQHAANVVRDPHGASLLDGTAFSLTAGAAFATGMSFLDRRKARKQR